MRRWLQMSRRTRDSVSRRDNQEGADGEETDEEGREEGVLI